MRFDSANDLQRAFNRVYVKRNGKIYHTVTDDLAIHLYNKKGECCYIQDASKEFYLEAPCLGFAPGLLKHVFDGSADLMYFSRSPLRQYSFGVSAKTILARKYFVDPVTKKQTTKIFPGSIYSDYFWQIFEGVYYKVESVLENGGGLSSEYGVTQHGYVIFGSSCIGVVNNAKDGVSLFSSSFFNSIIRNDLEKIGVKKVVNFGKENL